MRSYIVTLLTLLALSSCDCVQQAKGLVLDRKTMQPISNVSLGKYEKEDSANVQSRRSYTDDLGQFDYSSISGGRQCPDLVLYFYKPGYKITSITLPAVSQNDTVYLDRITIPDDSSFDVSLAQFNRQVESCTKLLQTKQLKEISDDQHIEIMMCLNTIFMRHLKGGHYDHFEQVSEEKQYARRIVEVYPKWIPNRGMGFYFPKLKMELYGTPMSYAVYNIIQ